MNDIKEGIRSNLIEVSIDTLKGRFREMIWHNLQVECDTSQMSPCYRYCIKPCKMAVEFIKTAILLYWNEYVRAN